MYACDYLETGFLNVLRGVTFAAPTKVYLALFLNDPGDSGTAGTEISYAGYAAWRSLFLSRRSLTAVSVFRISLTLPSRHRLTRGHRDTHCDHGFSGRRRYAHPQRADRKSGYRRE